MHTLSNIAKSLCFSEFKIKHFGCVTKLDWANLISLDCVRSSLRIYMGSEHCNFVLFTEEEIMKDLDLILYIKHVI